MLGVWDTNTPTPQTLYLICFSHANCASFYFINLYLKFVLIGTFYSLYRARVENHYLSNNCFLELQKMSFEILKLRMNYTILPKPQKSILVNYINSLVISNFHCVCQGSTGTRGPLVLRFRDRFCKVFAPDLLFGRGSQIDLIFFSFFLDNGKSFYHFRYSSVQCHPPRNR